MAGVDLQTNKHKDPVFNLFAKIISLENFHVYGKTVDRATCTSLCHYLWGCITIASRVLLKEYRIRGNFRGT